jgi:hypothetical protein
MAKTKRAELDARREAQRVELANLQGLAATKGQEIAQLSELASSGLRSAALGDLDAESRRQAQAAVDVASARLAAVELARRIGEQQAAILATQGEMRAAERDELIAAARTGREEATVLAAALQSKIAAILATLTKLQNVQVDGGQVEGGDEIGFLGQALEQFITMPGQRARQLTNAIEDNQRMVLRQREVAIRLAARAAGQTPAAVAKRQPVTSVYDVLK